MNAFLLLLLIPPFVGWAQSVTPNLGLQLPAYQQQNWQVPINYDFTQLDLVLGGYQNLPIGSTPTISIGSNWQTENTVNTTITNFVGGFPGQTIRVICGSGDTYTSVSNSSSTIFLNSAWSCTNSHSLTLTLIGTVWTETSRAGGPGSGTPGGGLYAVQYNNTVFGGDATNFTYNPTTYLVTATGGLYSSASVPWTGSSGSNVAIKPWPDSGVQFVDPNGNSTNDGRSRGTPVWDTDVGKALNDAYANLPSVGGIIYVSSLGGASSFSTPIVFGTSGKIAVVVGAGQNVTNLQYTGSSGVALTMDSGTNSSGLNAILKNIAISTAVSGSTVTGVEIGVTNGAPYTLLDGVSISGFKIGVLDNSYGIIMRDSDIPSCSSASGSIGFETSSSGSNVADDTVISGKTIQGCATLIAVNSADPVWVENTTLSATNATSTVASVMTGGALFGNRDHFYNGGTNSIIWFTDAGNFILSNSQFEDSLTTGSSASYATQSAGFVDISHSVVYSAGHSVTEFLNSSAGNQFFSSISNTASTAIPLLSNSSGSDPFAVPVSYKGTFTSGDDVKAVNSGSGANLYLQDAGGVAALLTATQTLTNKTFDATSNIGLRFTQTSAATNFGSTLSTQTIVASTPATGEMWVSIQPIESLLGVGCSSTTNSVSINLSFTSPGSIGQSASTISTLSITGDGTQDSGSGAGIAATGYLFPIAVKTGTAITYTTSSTLGSTGCSTTPQYTVYAKAIY